MPIFLRPSSTRTLRIGDGGKCTSRRTRTRADENDEDDHTGYGVSPGLDDGGGLPHGQRRPSEAGTRVETAPPHLRRLWENPSRPQRLWLRQLAGSALFRQERGHPLRGLAKRAILLVVLGEPLEDDDRVPLRRAVLQTENREASNRRIRVARGQSVEHPPVCVHGGRPVTRKQLEREQRRPACCRALVLEPSPKQLELLAVAELPDRAVRDCALAEVRAAGRAFELVVPAGPQRRELALGAGRCQLVGFGGR